MPVGQRNDHSEDPSWSKSPAPCVAPVFLKPEIPLECNWVAVLQCLIRLSLATTAEKFRPPRWTLWSAVNLLTCFEDLIHVLIYATNAQKRIRPESHVMTQAGVCQCLRGWRNRGLSLAWSAGPYGTMLGEAGFNAYDIDKLMGHANISTSQRYIRNLPVGAGEAVMLKNQRRHSNTGPTLSEQVPALWW